MTRRTELRTAGVALALLVALPAAAAVVLTGEVRAVDAQAIYTPQSNASPVVIRYFVPDGQRVKRGDVVLRIDPGQSATQIPDLEAGIEQARARAAKELAELEVKAVDAALALADADAALAIAKLDAAIPPELISRLDHDRHQGELDRAARELALKRKALTAAGAAVARRRGDGRLEVQKLKLQLDYHQAQVRTAEVRADRAGVVLHGFNNNWIGGRIDEGASTMPGSKAGEVVSGSAMRISAWALEPDRRGLRVGQAVQLAFDALPGRPVPGRISAVAGAPIRKPEWGEGRYFAIDIALSAGPRLALLPGMSVRVTVPTPQTGAAPAAVRAGR